MARDVSSSESYMHWTSLETKFPVPLSPTKALLVQWGMSSFVDVSGTASMCAMKYINMYSIEPPILWFACLDLNLKAVRLEKIVLVLVRDEVKNEATVYTEEISEQSQGKIAKEHLFWSSQIL